MPPAQPAALLMVGELLVELTKSVGGAFSHCSCLDVAGSTQTRFGTVFSENPLHVPTCPDESKALTGLIASLQAQGMH